MQAESDDAGGASRSQYSHITSDAGLAAAGNDGKCPAPFPEGQDSQDRADFAAGSQCVRACARVCGVRACDRACVRAHVRTY